MNKALVWAICCVSFVVGIPRPGGAAIVSWNNAGGGNWNVGANWVGGVVPGASDTAVIDLAGTYTVTLTGTYNVAGIVLTNADATLQILALHDGGGFTPATLTAATGFTNYGTIALDCSGSGGFTCAATLAVTSGTLINEGTINFLQGAGVTALLAAELDNRSTVTVDANDAQLAKAGAQHINQANGTVRVLAGRRLNLRQSGAVSRLTNHGLVELITGGPGGRVDVQGAEFVNEIGAVIALPSGTSFFAYDTGPTNATFQFNGGTIGPNYVSFSDSADLAFGAGALGSAGFLITESCFLSGDIPEGVTVLVQAYHDGGSFTPATLTAATGFTNHGTIALDCSGSGGFTCAATLAVTFGTLINEGTINFLQGAGVTALLAAELDNRSTVTVDANDAQLAKAGAQHINQANGTVRVLAGRRLNLRQSGAVSRLTNHGLVELITGGPGGRVDVQGAEFVNEIGAVIALPSGTSFFAYDTGPTNATFQFNGGTIGPNYVSFSDSADLAFGAGALGSAGFLITESCFLSGDIPEGVTVLVQAYHDGGSFTPATLTAATGFTNHGTIALDCSGSGGFTCAATLAVTFGTLINEGTINFLQGAGVTALLAAELQNNGKVNVTVNATLQKAGANHVNSGDIIIASAATFTIIGASFHDLGTTITGGGTLSLPANTDFFGETEVGSPAVVNITAASGCDLSPGDPPTATTGLFENTGTANFQGGSDLNMAIGGLAPGATYDRWNVSGAATLNGGLNVSFTNRFLPCNGDEFTVLTYGSQTGSFPNGITGLAHPNSTTLTASVGAAALTLTGVGPAADSDGDGIPDNCDSCPGLNDPNRADSDFDGVGDACDLCPGADDLIDSDGDIQPDFCDNCVGVPNTDQADCNSDNTGDACEVDPTLRDDDADTICNGIDNCPVDPNTAQTNSDADPLGDACDNCPMIDNAGQEDMEADTVGDACDNCLAIDNPSQVNSDMDALGDACDNCPQVDNDLQEDGDLDAVGDACDNCPGDPNTGQLDSDVDTVGDACDNCALPNTNQADCNGDTLGDVCNIAGGSSCDLNANVVPDECECQDNDACTRDHFVAGACAMDPVEFGDLDGNGAVDLDDILCVLDGFGDYCVCVNGDLIPCVSNGVIDLNDILAVLDAFGGADPCDCP